MPMDKLTTGSQILLGEMLQSENPTQLLRDKLINASSDMDDKLRSIIRELHRNGLINVLWADNVPYKVTIHNSVPAYAEQLKECKSEEVETSLNKRKELKIFISHRSTDKAIADALFDFMVSTGIPRNEIFCSSLPGNDVKQKISAEVKNTIKNSCLNIAILSNEYYNSAYCLNEAGILWFRDALVIPIALPEIEPSNMIGFLDADYKIRRLDNADDIAYIYDCVCDATMSPQAKVSVVTSESRKLMDKYKKIISGKTSVHTSSKTSSLEITTDDERIVLYYLISKQVRKVSKNDIRGWLQNMEIYDVNVDNAFDLLSTMGNGSVENETLIFDVDTFRRYSKNSKNMLTELFPYVKSHINLSSEKFTQIWRKNAFDDSMKLFAAYIIDEKIDTFGDRWMSEMQIKDIESWENKHSLDSILSSDYGKCLSLYINNRFVYESEWTSYGNARAYTLCESLKELLFNNPNEFLEDIKLIKDKYYYELPF